MAVAYTQAQLTSLSVKYNCAANATAVTDAIANAEILNMNTTKRSELLGAVYTRLATVETKINSGFYDASLSTQTAQAVAATIVI